MSHHHSSLHLYSRQSKRLYLNRSERAKLEEIAADEQPPVRCLILVLLYTGCRLSEALNIKSSDIQSSEGLIAIRSLKKRDIHHVRELAVPLNIVKQLIALVSSKSAERLFSQSRTTAWRQIKSAMAKAGIVGEHATPKGLRHSFGVHCAFNNVPMPLAQKWLGHADIKTTAIYYQIVGKEEREMASRLW